MAILRRVKEKLAQIIKKTKKAAGSRDIPGKIKRSAERPVAEKKDIMGQQETAIGKTKFYTAEAPMPPRAMPDELPGGYGQDKIILQVRDPRWLHAYWEVNGPTYEGMEREFGDDFRRARRVLRVYDVSQIIFDGNNAHSFFDIQVSEYANNWYIDTAGPGRSWCVDFGLLLPDGRFITIVRSNTVSTPLEGPSWITDEEWMIPEEMFARLYGMGFGLGRSSPVGKAWQERVKKELFSGAFSSGASVASPVKRPSEQRNFWLVVNTELIVYGATEPDAKVSIQDKRINLRPDGTFSMRFALPNGKQVVPVKAISSDNKEERTITPVVTRETK